MKKKYIITFLTEFLVFLSIFITYKIVANSLGKECFSEYNLVRRMVSFIIPIILLAFCIGIPRYIAYAKAEFDILKANTYFVSGFIFVILLLTIFTIAMNLFKNNFAFIFFGNASYNYLIFPISLVICGLVLQSLCYSYFQGKLMMVQANLMQIINASAIPLVIFYFFGDSLYSALLKVGIATTIISVIFLFYILFSIKFITSKLVICLKELLIYGVQRIPGDLGLPALLTLPVVITTHMFGVKEAGYMAFGISIVNVVGAIFAPAGLIMLPQTAHMFSNNKLEPLKGYVNKILKIALGLTALGLVIFEIFAPQIIKIYLGSAFLELVLVARIILLGSLGYTVYITMRSIIDAYYVKAMNTKNIIISLLAFILLTLYLFFIHNYIYLSISFTVTMFLLGILTIYDIKKIFIIKI